MKTNPKGNSKERNHKRKRIKKRGKEEEEEEKGKEKKNGGAHEKKIERGAREDNQEQNPKPMRGVTESQHPHPKQPDDSRPGGLGHMPGYWGYSTAVLTRL